MTQWPPEMPTDIYPSWKDWLMTPFIMFSVGPNFLRVGCERNHWTWKFSENDFPPEWRRESNGWKQVLNEVVDRYLVDSRMDLDEFVEIHNTTTTRRHIGRGSYSFPDYIRINALLERLKLANATVYDEIYAYALRVQNPNNFDDFMEQNDLTTTATTTPKKWKLLYQMNQWPPVMSNNESNRNWWDWLMVPLIMFSIGDVRISRRHSTWTFDESQLPREWRDSWMGEVKTIVDAFLRDTNMPLENLIKVYGRSSRGRKGPGPYTLIGTPEGGPYYHIKQILERLKAANSTVYDNIEAYAIRVQHPRKFLKSGDDDDNGTAFITKIMEGVTAIPEMHEIPRVRKMANNFVESSFKERMAICPICSERWYVDIKPSRQNGYICKPCVKDKKLNEEYRFTTANDMNPLAHEDKEVVDLYRRLLLEYPLSNIEERLISLHIPVMQVYRLKSQASLFKGHCIAFPQKVDQIASKLPRIPRDCKVFKVRMRSGEDPIEFRDFIVRRKYIEKWLEFLTTYNPYYKRVDIDNETLRRLPENDSVYNQLDEFTPEGTLLFHSQTIHHKTSQHI
jgi:hypothetical protein